MSNRIPGFHGEYLWELDISQWQLTALADAVPEAGYPWRPVEGTRSFSAVLVHIALGNFALLHLIGVQPESSRDLYGPLSGDPFSRFAEIIRKERLAGTHDHGEASGARFAEAIVRFSAGLLLAIQSRPSRKRWGLLSRANVDSQGLPSNAGAHA
jgi:hypothetical protein